MYEKDEEKEERGEGLGHKINYFLFNSFFH
jgi:hypothetical protein